MAMQPNLTVKKIIALLNALAKLHIFCIGETDNNATGGGNGGGGGGGQHGKEVPPLLNRDTHFITNNSHGHVGLGVDNMHHSTAVPTDLIHLGEHFIDVPEIFVCVYRKNMSTVELPRTQLFNMIVDGHWERPK